MAKVLFISVNDINAEGIRSMSAGLKKNGHQPYIIFLKRYSIIEEVDKNIKEYDWVGINTKGRFIRYARGQEITDNEKSMLLGLIKKIKPDLIGFTVCTPLKRRIIDVSKLIKDNFDIPIIWGGPDPTTDPEDCLSYCDFICIGEAEKTIVDIAVKVDNKGDINQVKNLAYIKNSQFISNSMYLLTENLNELPFKDIYPDNKFLIESNSLVQNFSEISYSRNFRYHIISSRGCPYNCSYCCENYFKKMYFPENFLRRRSPSNVVQELKEAKKIINYKMVQFEDEIFSIDYNWLKEFKDLYKREINLPFICYIYPNKEFDKQLEALKEAGLTFTCLALQSGSEKINKEVFNRFFNKELYIKMANKLKSMGIGYYVDIITYNPFENEEDLRATLDILIQLPKPFLLNITKLMILKGTKMYDLVQALNKNKEKRLLSDKIFNYYSRLFLLTAFTRYYKYLIYLIQKIKIFKLFPFLINPFLLNLPFYLTERIKKVIKNPKLVYDKLIRKIRRQ